MNSGPVSEKSAASLLLAAACFDLIPLITLTPALAIRIETTLETGQIEVVTLGTLACLLLLYWVCTELLLGGRTLGRFVLQLAMIGPNGQPATKLQRTTRAMRKITTFGLAGLRFGALAPYDRKTKIAWVSPLAPKSRRPLPEWQLQVASGPERGKTITFGRTRGFQNNKSIKIGRDSGWADLPLSSANNVSGQHAVLMVRDGGLKIMDNGSTNGTSLNGKRIPPKKWVNLSAVDHFFVADVKVQLVR